MELTKVTIDDITYNVEPVAVNKMVTSNHHVFYGISWYKVIDFNLHNHIKKNATTNNSQV
jgi:hypothetical protein